MALTLYHMQHTRSLRILWLLEEMNLEYNLNKVERADLQGEDYLSKSSLGKVPVFFDGDKRITESIAAIQYIADQHSGDQLTRKPNDPDYHTYLQLMEFGESGMGGYAGLLVGHTVLLPEKNRNPAVRDWAQGEIDKCLSFLEESVPDDEYLLGDFSLADISITYLLFLLKITKNSAGFGDNTNAYFKRVTQRSAWVKASSL